LQLTDAEGVATFHGLAFQKRGKPGIYTITFIADGTFGGSGAEESGNHTILSSLQVSAWRLHIHDDAGFLPQTQRMLVLLS
jgi:hypothetical protein